MYTKNVSSGILEIMKKLPQNQQGFIPMMLSIIAVIAFIIYLVYSRVASGGM